MMDLEDVKRLLQDRVLATVAAETGLSYMTVWRIKIGKADNVTLDTLRKLSDYLERR